AAPGTGRTASAGACHAHQLKGEPGTMTIKHIVTTSAMLLALASPAFAQDPDPSPERAAAAAERAQAAAERAQANQERIEAARQRAAERAAERTGRGEGAGAGRGTGSF